MLTVCRSVFFNDLEDKRDDQIPRVIRSRNPFPGKIFNDYLHRDVYQGVVIDYRGKDVTPSNFIRVLLGDEQLKAEGKKVLSTGPMDNIFIYFSDHGAPNHLVFPNAQHNLQRYTVEGQLHKLEEAVTDSHVTMYGDRKLMQDVLAEYQASGEQNTSSIKLHPSISDLRMIVRDKQSAQKAHLVSVIRQSMHASSQTRRELASRRLRRAIQLGELVTEIMEDVYRLVKLHTTELVPPDSKIKQLECFEIVYAEFELRCFSVHQVPEVAYETFTIQEICASGVDTKIAIQSIREACG
ncbi:unnamed protein product [Echinostoma caproni]|uniref:Legumain n=1 Tax=Echinostoma caproni TaxID=27848 RepID=A0A183AAS7_9TREM|nr:unnamed protein product [Echinostoma caproni]